MFDFRLMRESSIRSRKAGEKNISPNSVRKVTEVGRTGAFISLPFERLANQSLLLLENTTKIQGLIGPSLDNAMPCVEA